MLLFHIETFSWNSRHCRYSNKEWSQNGRLVTRNRITDDPSLLGHPFRQENKI